MSKDTVLMMADEGTRTTLDRVKIDGTRKALGDTGPVCFAFDANASGTVAVCAGERATTRGSSTPACLPSYDE